MRIGMILDAVFPPDPRVENEAVSLIKAGHEVFLFCLHYGQQNPSEVINGIQVKRFLSNKLEYKFTLCLQLKKTVNQKKLSKKQSNLKKNLNQKFLKKLSTT